jgi:hypothetical protein
VPAEVPALVGPAPAEQIEPSALEAKIEAAPVVFLEAPVPVVTPKATEPPASDVKVATVVAKKRGRPSKIDQFVDKIGVIPDKELAALAGVGLGTVKKWREKGLPAAKVEPSPTPEAVVEPNPEPAETQAPSKKRAPRPVKQRKARRTRMDAYLDQIGVLPDAEVAGLAGVSPANVAIYRKRRSIPAPPKRARRRTVEPLVAPVPKAPTVEAPPVLEPVEIQLIGAPEPTTPATTDVGTVRAVRLTDRVEGMLQALAKLRGIDPEAALAVAIAQDYLHCSPLIE